MILCIDCGLTKGKLMLMDFDGVSCGETSFSTPLCDTTVDTHSLRELLYRSIKELLKNTGIASEKIHCITVSGHGNGLYALGEEDVLPTGYSSMVTDSAAFLPQPGKTFPIILQSDWAGQPLPILAWLKETQPEVYHNIKTILFCKDLLRWFLTGVAATEETDASAAGLLNARSGQYDCRLLQIYGIEDACDKLPNILKSDAIAGRVTPEVAEKTGLCPGTSVLAGLFDVNSCMLGSGVIDDSAYALIAGTWGINASVSKTLVEAPSITQCCRFFGSADYVCIDSAPTSCSNLEWFVKTVLDNMPYEQVNALVEQQPCDEDLIYLPYLYAPMDIPKAKGGFVGLKTHHTKAAMLRAVYEGIIFEHRYRLEKLQVIGIHTDTAVLSGGASNSDVFAQMFADVCELKILTPVQTQAGALGGTILGATAMGIYPNISTAVNKIVRYRSEFQPNANCMEYYRRKYQKFKELQMPSPQVAISRSWASK